MEQNRTTGAEVRQETQRLRGAHLSNSVTLVPPASDAEVSRLATLLMQQLNKIEVEPSNRSWFKLFKMCDEDNVRSLPQCSTSVTRQPCAHECD